MNELDTIRKLYHSLGHKLLDNGITMCRKAYQVNPRTYTRSEILNFLTNQLNLPASTISLADEIFYVETVDKWKTITEMDLLNYQKYLADIRDCDNYAMTFSARGSLIYGLNSCATAFGNIYDVNTKKLLFRHAFNLIITHENGVLKLKIYEPQTDELKDWIKGGNNVLKIGIYKPDWCLLF